MEVLVDSGECKCSSPIIYSLTTDPMMARHMIVSERGSAAYARYILPLVPIIFHAVSASGLPHMDMTFPPPHHDYNRKSIRYDIK